MDAVFRTLASIDIELTEEGFSYLANCGRTVLLLDGFDEIEDELVKQTVSDLDFLSQKYPELQRAITSRPGNEIQKSTNFRLFKILPLRSPDYGQFLRKLGLDIDKIHSIRVAIDSSPSKASNLITTPLMLTLVVIVYNAEKEIPATLPEFFERLFQVVFTRHDTLKAAFARKRHSGLSERRLQTLFEAFCFMVMQKRVLSLTYD
jgi:predicted NACHT family NTPase